MSQTTNRRRSKGDPSLAKLLVVFLALLAIAGAFAGYLGEVTRGQL